jgi:hypothetical protein
VCRLIPRLTPRCIGRRRVARQRKGHRVGNGLLFLYVKHPLLAENTSLEVRQALGGKRGVRGSRFVCRLDGDCTLG